MSDPQKSAVAPRPSAMTLPSHIGRAPAAASRAPTYALVGNPNCGKSTLFNALTGLKQKVGNYPRVTVEQELGVPVIACEAVNGKGIIELKLAMSRADLPLSRHAWDVPAPIAPAVAELQASLTASDRKPPLIARAEALLLLTDQDTVRVAGSTPLHARTHEILRGWQERWEGEGTDWAGTLVNSRYEAIGKIAGEV